MINFLKRLICRRELETLNRYRQACRDVNQEDGYEFPVSAVTARWIYEFAEGETLNGDAVGTGYMGISKFRDWLRKGIKGVNRD